MNVSEYSPSRVPTSSIGIANVGVGNIMQARRSSTFHSDAWNDFSSKHWNEHTCTQEGKPEINTSFHCFSRNFGQIPKGGNVVHQAYRNAAFYPQINSKMDPSSILRHILNSRESERQNRVFPNTDHAVNLPDIERSIPRELDRNISRRPISSSGLKEHEKAAEMPYSKWARSDREVKSAGQKRAMKSRNLNPSCRRSMPTTADTIFENISKKISEFEKRSTNAAENSKFPKRRKSSNIKAREKNGHKFAEKVATKRRLVPISLDTGPVNSHRSPITNKKAPVTRWVSQTDPKEIITAENTFKPVQKESRSNHCHKQLYKLNPRKQCFCGGSNNQNESVKSHCWSRHLSSYDLDGNWSFGKNILANRALLNGSQRERNCRYCRDENNIAPGNYVFGFCDQGSHGGHNLRDLTAEHGRKLYTTNAKFQSISRQNSLAKADNDIENNCLNVSEIICQYKFVGNRHAF